MTRKALLIGINDYAPAGPGGPDLQGCVPDVQDVAHTLNALGIVPAKPGTLRILTDVRATRTNILNGLKWLLTKVKKGDLIIFYYSGHGSQLPDLEGDEIDGKDETLCPHDYSTAGMITDDDLRQVLSGVPAGVALEVILDSCHSGTGTRETAALSSAPLSESLSYRYVDPPLDYCYFLDANPSLPTRRILRRTGGGKDAVAANKLNHVLWAACWDNQTSAETRIEGSPISRGVFTYCFCKVLRRTGADITRDRLDALVSADIKRLGFGQVPQLEGTKEALAGKVFS